MKILPRFFKEKNRILVKGNKKTNKRTGLQLKELNLGSRQKEKEKQILTLMKLFESVEGQLYQSHLNKQFQEHSQEEHFQQFPDQHEFNLVIWPFPAAPVLRAFTVLFPAQALFPGSLK